MLLRLALQSMLNRRVTTCLSVLSIAFSVALLLGVERLRESAKRSFETTIADVDLIVGARTGPIQLLLYSVFRLGNATQNISLASLRMISDHPEVEWVVPVSLGDSHQGYRVVGTTAQYFEKYRYGSPVRPLQLAQGKFLQAPEQPPFNPDEVLQVVLGSQVAEDLKYHLGSRLHLSHGVGEVSFQQHDNLTFRVVGILRPTGTPVDHSVHIGLAAMEAIHIGWEDGAAPKQQPHVSQMAQWDLQPRSVTAAFIKSKSRIGIFNLQREINDTESEALMAVIPGLVFRDLWGTINLAEQALRLVSVFVFLTGLLGVMTTLYTHMEERRREMAILRSCGARPGHILSLLVAESGVLTTMGSLLGFCLVFVGTWLVQPFFADSFGLSLVTGWPTGFEGVAIMAMIGLGFLIGLVPGIKAYRNSLADGLTIKV